MAHAPVINKLITEEDLYGAVDAAFSQGWRRVKLYFLIGLPTERDEDVLGIAELGAALREIGRRHHEVGHRRRVGRGIRPQAAHAVPVVRHGHRSRAGAQGGAAPREAERTRGLTIRWHDPAASAAEGLASRGDRRMGAVIERVWRAGGTFQEWSERFDLRLWEEALAAEGLSFDEVCHRDRGERRGSAVGPHLGRPAPRLSLGRLAGRARQRRRRGLPLDAVLRLRRLHRVRARARRGVGRASGGRQPGHRPGPRRGPPDPGPLVSRAPLRRAPPAPAVLQGGQDPLHQPPRRGADVGAGAPPQRAPRGLLPGLRAAPAGQLRPGPADGVRVLGEYLDVRLGDGPARGDARLRELPAALSALLPDGIEVQVGGPVGDTEGSLQQEVASCTWELEVLSVPGEELAERVEKLLAAPGPHGPAGTEGSSDRRRRPPGHPGAVRPPGAPDGHLRAELATRPRGCGPVTS